MIIGHNDKCDITNNIQVINSRMELVCPIMKPVHTYTIICTILLNSLHNEWYRITIYLKEPSCMVMISFLIEIYQQ